MYKRYSSLKTKRTFVAVFKCLSDRLFYSNAVLDTPFSLPVSASRDDLSHLINQLLDGKQKEFDFLINGTLIRSQVETVINQLHINTVSKKPSSGMVPCSSLFLGRSSTD